MQLSSLENLEPMTWLSILIGFVLLLTLILYLSWTCIMREKTFEEVIAEQFRKEQVALIKSGKAIKKDKFKKKFAEKRQKKKEQSTDDANVQVVDKKSKKKKKISLSISEEDPIIELETLALEKKKKTEEAKAKKAEAKAQKQEAKRLKALEDAANIEEEFVSVSSDVLSAAQNEDILAKQYAEEMDEAEEMTCIESQLINAEPQQEEIQEDVQEEEIEEIPENLFFKDLKLSVEENDLDDNEVQSLVDVLLQKHSDARPLDWSQAGVNGQSIEKLQLEIEEYKQEITNVKANADETVLKHDKEISDLRMEFQVAEDKFQENIATQAAEVNALHARLSKLHESHKDEITKMRIQMESKKDHLIENHLIQMKAITEENNTLKEATSQMVPQSQFANLQTQWKIAHEELNKQIAEKTSHEGWRKNYENKIARYEEEIRSMDISKNERENYLTQQINVLSEELNHQKEMNNNNLNEIEQNQTYVQEISNLKCHLSTMERSHLEIIDSQDSKVKHDISNAEVEDLKKKLQLSDGTKGDLEIQLKEVISEREEAMTQLQKALEKQALMEEEIQKLKELPSIKQEINGERTCGEGAESEELMKQETVEQVEATPKTETEPEVDTEEDFEKLTTEEVDLEIKTEEDSKNVNTVEADQVKAAVDIDQLNDLQADLELKTEEVIALKLSVEDLTSKLSNLQSQNEELISQKAELDGKPQEESDVADIDLKDEEVNALKLSVEVSSSKISDLQSQIEDNISREAELEAELKDKSSEIDHLKSSYDELTNKMNEIENAKAELKSIDDNLVETSKDSLETSPDDEEKVENEQLKSDLEAQIKKNNDLRERNWKAMEALSKAEKTASEVKHELVQKEEELKSLKITNTQSLNDDDNEVVINKLKADLDKKASKLSELEDHLNEEEEKYESTMKDMKTKCEKLESQLAKSSTSLSELEDFLNEKEEAFDKEKELLEKKISELEKVNDSATSNGVASSEKEFDTLKKNYEELQNTLNDKTSVVDNLYKEISNLKGENESSNTEQERTRELLRRLFPSITVDEQELEHSEWLLGFELEANKYLEIMTSNSVDAEVMKRLEETELEKQRLDDEVQKFKKILEQTEENLTKLQSSVEDEEKKWRESLDEKEEDCRQLKDLVDNLQTELETAKQSNEGVTELSQKYKELEVKFKEFETSKCSEYEEKCKVLNEKLLSSESDREYSTSKLEAMEIELDEIKSKLDTSVSEKGKLESHLNSTEEKMKSYDTQLEESLKEQTSLRSKLSLLEAEKESLKVQATTKIANGTLDTTQELSEVTSGVNNDAGSPV